MVRKMSAKGLAAMSLKQLEEREKRLHLNAMLASSKVRKEPYKSKKREELKKRGESYIRERDRTSSYIQRKKKKLKKKEKKAVAERTAKKIAARRRGGRK